MQRLSTLSSQIFPRYDFSYLIVQNLFNYQCRFLTNFGHSVVKSCFSLAIFVPSNISPFFVIINIDCQLRYDIITRNELEFAGDNLL